MAADECAKNNLAKYRKGDVVELYEKPGAKYHVVRVVYRRNLFGAGLVPHFVVEPDNGGSQIEVSKREIVGNSRACNAKFKIGDKVKHKTNGLTGVVEGQASDPDHYNVRSGGRMFMWDKDDLVLANSAVRSTNAAVQEALNSACARNSAEVEVSLQYAARVQQAMRDAVRMVSGVRQSSTNTLYCPDDDAAEEVVEILTDAGVPKNEVWINARKVRNADNFASDKLRNEWNSAFRSLKRLHDMAAAEKHQSVMDAANAAAKTLMDRTKW